MFDIDADFSDYDKMVNYLESEMRPGMEAVVAQIMEDGANRARGAQFEDHRGPAGIRASIKSGLGSDGSTESMTGGATIIEGYIRADSEEASFLEYDTKPHEILPKQRRQRGQAGAKTKRGSRMLRFEAGGNVIFARRVSHPGTKGIHFIGNSMTEGEFLLRVADGADKIIEKGSPSRG